MAHGKNIVAQPTGALPDAIASVMHQILWAGIWPKQIESLVFLYRMRAISILLTMKAVVGMHVAVIGKKSWLLRVADKVERRSQMYANQLRNCRARGL